MVSLGAPNRLRGAIMFVAGASLVAGAAFVQHRRHGWPFSLHHGLGAERSHGLDAARAIRSAPDTEAARARANRRVAVTVDPVRLESLGIGVDEVLRADVAGELRVVATVVPDEGRVAHVHTRVAGWIDRLAVRTTGETVRAGQVLATIFSQELMASQNEYLAVIRAGAAHGATATASPSPLARGARERLRVLGMSEAGIDELERRGEATRSVSITAPRGGVVIHRGVTVGTSVDPSTELFTIADLSHVWVLGEVPESRAADVRVGSHAAIELPSSRLPPVDATVEFVYPTLSEATRTLRVRFSIANPDGSFRPGTFGTATIHVEPRTALVVPRDAVVDTGNEQHVFVVSGEGHFVPRTVHIGARLADRVEVVEGLVAGERVVSSGVFLLDSESRLRASGGGTGHAHGAAAERAPASGGEHAGHGR